MKKKRNILGIAALVGILTSGGTLAYAGSSYEGWSHLLGKAQLISWGSYQTKVTSNASAQISITQLVDTDKLNVRTGNGAIASAETQGLGTGYGQHISANFNSGSNVNLGINNHYWTLLGTQTAKGSWRSN